MMKRFFLSTILIVVLLTACGGGKQEIIISGKPWTEQFILPYILGLVIEEHTDYQVTYKDGLGEVAILTPAIDKGEIDVYVEYTGTGLMDVLEEETEPGESSESVYERVKAGYEEAYDVTWLEPLGFENTYTLAYAKESGIDATTYSDLAEYSKGKEMVFGAPHAFYERVGEGYDDLVKAYPFEFSDTKSLDPNIMYDAVKNGEVDVIPGFTTDSRLQLFDLVTTEDDLQFFPKYDAVPIVRQELLEEMPELADAINKLAGQISEEDMLQMNARVDIDDEKPEEVARQFLIEKGLIPNEG
ncbi:glycine betaine ABC transporter substrate-binding protein [Pseudogracilibacillus auburnensis]